MNKFDTILNDAKYFSKLLGHMHLVALEVNKTQEETRQDFWILRELDSARLVFRKGGFVLVHII